MQNFPKEILEAIRVHLEEEKKQLITRIAALTAQDPFGDVSRTSDNAASDAEASEEADHDRVGALIEELKVKQTAIDQALVRIEQGTYGFCTDCQAMIDTDRLNILPTATLCRTCEEKRKR